MERRSLGCGCCSKASYGVTMTHPSKPGCELHPITRPSAIHTAAPDVGSVTVVVTADLPCRLRWCPLDTQTSSLSHPHTIPHSSLPHLHTYTLTRMHTVGHSFTHPHTYAHTHPHIYASSHTVKHTRTGSTVTPTSTYSMRVTQASPTVPSLHHADPQIWPDRG